jgi:tetratricopeptide (TPR) repeat protein
VSPFGLAVVLYSLFAVSPKAALAQQTVIDVRGAARPPGLTSFEGLWAAYVKADRAGDKDAARKIFQEIRRLRIERNVRNLEEIGLALVGLGSERLAKGNAEESEEFFRSAIGLAPALPDAYFGLAASEVKKSPLGLFRAVSHVISGSLSRTPTVRGRYNLDVLVLPVLLLTLFATAVVFGVVLILRHGALLVRDLQEAVLRGHSRSMAQALALILLVLPVATFQGWGWLPLWWFAVLFLYLSLGEKALAVVLLLASIAAVPAVTVLQQRMEAARNPLFWAAAQAVEGGPDARSTVELERSVKAFPDDRDLAYLLGRLYKKAGRYDDAIALYRQLLAGNPKDAVALMNLANVEFARGEFQSALARYKQGAETASDPEVKATFYYNQSLAHLQKFEMQPGDEALSNAKRLAAGLIDTYDSIWKYDKGDYAVVDLGLDVRDVQAKFTGTPDGVGIKNVTGGATASMDWGALALAGINRFSGFGALALVVVLGIWLVRGKKMFTLRCLKCGMIFDARDHRGGAAAGLCPQCYHLFIVRDGVSAPARNRKLLEVQGWEGKRERIFRTLQVFSPGAGHLYAHRTLLGVSLVLLWYLVLSLSILAGRLLPFTEASSALAGRSGLAVATLLLLAIFVLANRLRPEFEAMAPVRRGAPRRTART